MSSFLIYSQTDGQLNNRHITQLEELEQLKGKLSCPSQRSRNLSSDRQYTPCLTSEVRNQKIDKFESQSVEKFKNLTLQNQKVENLFTSWKQQKQSISLNSSQHGQSQSTKSQTNKISTVQDYQSLQPKYTHLVIEEEENLVTEQDLNQGKVQAANNVRVAGKFPVSVKSAQQRKMIASQPQQPSTTNRKTPISQTTKPQTITPQTPQQVQKKAQSKNNTIKSFQDSITEVPSTPSQKMKQSSLLEKSRQGKLNQAVGKVLTKKSQEEERNLINQITKMKETITKLYDKQFEKQMTHSSQFIEKNLEQIINTMKLDFKCLENDI